MIAKLSGLVDSQSNGWMILDVNGVGYKVFCSNKTLSQAPSRGEACQLYIETIVREDAITLYGFMESLEQSWFTLLTSVQGVGSKVALSILSVCEIDSLAMAIAAQDTTYLTRADGVGSKLATRIVTELKGKEIACSPGFSIEKNSPGLLSKNSQETRTSLEDAISALTNLGYKRLEAAQAIHKVAAEQDNAPLDTLIKEGLKALAGGA